VAAVAQPPPVAASSVPAGFVVVAVAGRVRNPGLVRLPAGSRVADALDAAGGALPGTDVSFVNLARKLVDGELVVIGATPPPGAVDAGTGGGAPAGKVNLNTATATQLETLPGVGPVLAQHIVDYRTKHGQFKTVDELRQVDGLGASRFNQIKDLVTV
jgi:competence protein ComEA